MFGEVQTFVSDVFRLKGATGSSVFFLLDLAEVFFMFLTGTDECCCSDLRQMAYNS